MKSERLNEYEASIKYGFSPELLRWLTENPVVDKEVLPYEEVLSIYYFKEEDLKALDTKMSGFWPIPKKGSRPTMPAGIKREIKEEAYFSCPVCHRTPGEVAHIKPVAKSYSNHPKNLLFLCANHHTEYDFGHIYNNVSLEDVLSYKESLVRYKKHRWQIHGKMIKTDLGALNAVLALQKLPKKIRDADRMEFDKLCDSAISLVQGGKSKKIKLDVVSLEADILTRTSSGLEHECPLCEGRGETAYYDICPVCYGNGQLEYAVQIDLGQYELVECHLCDGTGKHQGETCPACDGEGELPRGVSDNVDWTQYENVECHLCDGTGKHQDETCPACDGEGELPRGVSDNVDWTQSRVSGYNSNKFNWLQY